MPVVYAARGLYSSQFRVLLQAAATRLNRIKTFPDEDDIEIHATAYDAVGGSLPRLEHLRRSPYSSSSDDNNNNNIGIPSIDAILVTGSAASAYDKYPWIAALQSFLQKVHADFPHVRIFGSCFGHQIIAQALLSSSAGFVENPHNALHVEPCPHGFEIGIHPVTLNREFVNHFAPCLPQLAEKDVFRIQLVHGDRTVPTSTTPAIHQLPHPWLGIGSTEICPVQGLYLPGRVLTFQGHFEFDTFANRETCREFARRAGWSDDFRDASFARIGLAARDPALSTPADSFGGHDDDDSKLAAEMVLLFFAGRILCDQTSDGTVHVDRVDGLMTPPLVDV